MLGTYRRALSLPGAWRFSATGFVARLPIAIVGLGIVLYISGVTGSYAQAGILSAAFQISAAFGAVVTSRWTDRLGQSRLLPWLAAVNAAFLVIFVATVQAGLPLAAQALVAAVAGASQPSVGSMVRARWVHAAPDTERLRSAFALESIIDELIFSIGPLLTAALAFRAGLPVPLIVAAAIGLVGGIALAAQHRTQPPPAPRREARQREGEQVGDRGGALRQPGLLPIVIGALGVGGVFGSYEVSVVAFCEQKGAPGASGIILGLWAFGSLLGGVVFGARQWRVPLRRQVVVLAAVLAVVLVPAPFVGTVALLAVTTFVAGAAVAPALIANFSITERLVPGRLLTEGLTWTNSGLALGFSAGTSIGGIVIDALGTTASFVLPIASAGFAAAVAWLAQPVLSRAVHAPTAVAPVAPLNADPLPGPAPGGVVDDPDQAR